MEAKKQKASKQEKEDKLVTLLHLWSQLVIDYYYLTLQKWIIKQIRVK